LFQGVLFVAHSYILFVYIRFNSQNYKKKPKQHAMLRTFFSLLGAILNFKLIFIYLQIKTIQ
ncbi:MAG: hypothetical protein II353_06880, partial [Alistipes sp.]|nr:hypothetical protein [Alistipes sp.]